ncbi:hypothetical protein ACO1O0_001135 [Amphichorda felina]
MHFQYLAIVTALASTACARQVVPTVPTTHLIPYALDPLITCITNATGMVSGLSPDNEVDVEIRTCDEVSTEVSNALPYDDEGEIKAEDRHQYTQGEQDELCGVLCKLHDAAIHLAHALGNKAEKGPVPPSWKSIGVESMALEVGLHSVLQRGSRIAAECPGIHEAKLNATREEFYSVIPQYLLVLDGLWE